MMTHGSPSGDGTRQGRGVRGGEGLLTQTVPALQTPSPRPNTRPVAGAEDAQREVPLLPGGAGLSAKPSSKRLTEKPSPGVPGSDGRVKAREEPGPNSVSPSGETCPEPAEMERLGSPGQAAGLLAVV